MKNRLMWGILMVAVLAVAHRRHQPRPRRKRISSRVRSKMVTGTTFTVQKSATETLGILYRQGHPGRTQGRTTRSRSTTR